MILYQLLLVFFLLVFIFSPTLCASDNLNYVGGNMNIFVGNLSFETSDEELRTEFSAFGELTSVNVLKDKFTNKSRGFAFVEMPNKEEANKAVEALNGKSINGRNINASEARPREERTTSTGPRTQNSYNRKRTW